MSVFFKTIFKQRQPRSFGLKHRYYDERKDRLRKMEAEHDGHIPLNDHEAYRERLREKWRSQRSVKSNRSTLRILLIFAALMLVIYQWLLK